ncbi:anthranilate synthase component 1 [Natronospira proteinivora]|uniref:Anthranilate synthase component 1 n=1 Tax=Natronospira proteinivora TaxID=1807133 RepID=A0ABT1G8B2_9GAMM|nr:anthranilate synthase component I [Natronospira proteinivora]MCP1727547.1 anthranilate synthase component 1 [Natronospira proteinivora]
MDQSQFQVLARQGHNRIPVYREILADLETPLSTYLKLAHGKGPGTYLFESVQGGERWGRYSIIGLPARERLEVDQGRLRHYRDQQLLSDEASADPLDDIAQWQAGFSAPRLSQLPRFTGGLVGYFGYDTIRYIEPRLADRTQPDESGSPDIQLWLSEEVLVFDNLRGRLFLIVNVDPDSVDAWSRAQQRLDELGEQLYQPSPRRPVPNGRPLPAPEPRFPKADFLKAVETVRDYVRAGDAMQVVLSQRLSLPWEGDALDIYRALRCFNPSPYMYYMDLGDAEIAGSSPEILVRLEDEYLTVRPIAGTRPRGKTLAEDAALEEALLADPKELAEHLMLIDLGRNDLGRISQAGSVRLTDRMIVERYSHVMHIVSSVTGKLQSGLGAMDALKACFPAGTVSGAPKVRAMEIIDELEPVRRGIYSGAIGYLGWQGDMDTAIAIRTALLKDGRLDVQAGAGIVHDSVPEKEWEETLNKGKALIRAAELARKGLHRGDLF